MRWLIKQASSILGVLGCKSASFKQLYIAHPYLCFKPAKLIMVCLGVCGVCLFGSCFFWLLFFLFFLWWISK